MTAISRSRDDTRWSWSQFWKISQTVAILVFPVALAAGGFLVGKVLEHDKEIAVMHEKCLTKDESDRRVLDLKNSIDLLKQSINDLRVEITKVAVKEHEGR